MVYIKVGTQSFPAVLAKEFRDSINYRILYWRYVFTHTLPEKYRDLFTSQENVVATEYNKSIKFSVPVSIIPNECITHGFRIKSWK